MSSLPDVDTLLKPGQYKGSLEFMYLCTYDLYGRDNVLQWVFKSIQEFADEANMTHLIEADPTSTHGFGRRNVIIFLQDFFVNGARWQGRQGREGGQDEDNDADEETTQDEDVSAKSGGNGLEGTEAASLADSGNSDESDEYAMVYIIAYDPAAESTGSDYCLNDHQRFRHLEDMIVGYSSASYVMEELEEKYHRRDFRFMYDLSTVDAFGFEEGCTDETLVPRVVKHVSDHLREKHGDPANGKIFWSDWFDMNKPRSRRLQHMLDIPPHRGNQPWWETYTSHEDSGDDESDGSESEDEVSTEGDNSDQDDRNTESDEHDDDRYPDLAQQLHSLSLRHPRQTCGRLLSQ